MEGFVDFQGQLFHRQFSQLNQHSTSWHQLGLCDLLQPADLAQPLEKLALMAMGSRFKLGLALSEGIDWGCLLSFPLWCPLCSWAASLEQSLLELLHSSIQNGMASNSGLCGVFFPL